MSTEDDSGLNHPKAYLHASTGYISTDFDGLVDQRAHGGFQKWGFVILRGTYGNDAEWSILMALLKQSIVESLQLAKRVLELGPYLEWTVIEDRANLENASTDVVRARFLEWVAARSVERDGAQADSPTLIDRVPRFKYCIYINDACFDSIGAYKTRSMKWTLDPDGKVAIINSLYCRSDYENDDDRDTDEEDSDEGERDEGYAPIEGITDYEVGWAYTEVIDLGSLYASMCYTDEWHGVYRGRRPCCFHPGARRGRPLSEVDPSQMSGWEPGKLLEQEYWL
jgi:hypothetical protein